MRWSTDGETLLSGGKHLTLHSYAGCRRVASTRLPASVYDVEFLDRDTVVAGEVFQYGIRTYVGKYSLGPRIAGKLLYCLGAS